MRRNVITLVLGALLCASLGFAQGDGYVWEGADSSEALRIKYTPSVASYVATVQVASAAITITGPDVAAGGTIALSPTKTIAQTVTSINAITNASGYAGFQSAAWQSITTDTVSNKLVAASAAAIASKEWVYFGVWDTSQVKHYNIVPNWLNLDGQIEGGAVIVDVVGAPDGTGNVTVKVYENDTEIYSHGTITSPLYLQPSVINYTGTVTNATENTVSLDDHNIKPGIRMKTSKKYLIRATRATTATTGGIGVHTER
jgi:hypothetical protein